jgi:hypothetical protein
MQSATLQAGYRSRRAGRDDALKDAGAVSLAMGETETARATAKRATDATHRLCAYDQCQKPFTPARADARYCSPACRLKAHRATKAQDATTAEPAPSTKPRPGGHKLRRLDPNKPKRPVTPTPRLYAPPPTDDHPGKYPSEVIDDILRRVSHGETLTQACNSNPDFPSPPTVIDWVHENRHNLAERYARARDRQLERWADDLVDTSAEAMRTPEKAPGARLVLDAKKFLLSKLKPQVYGDKLDVTSAGKPLTSASDLDIAKALAHALMPALPAPEPIDVEAVPVKEEGEQ